MNPVKTDRLKHRLEAVLCSRKRSETTPALQNLEGPRYLPIGPIRSSFLGLPYRILDINHKEDLLRGLWEEGPRYQYSRQ